MKRIMVVAMATVLLVLESNALSFGTTLEKVNSWLSRNKGEVLIGAGVGSVFTAKYLYDKHQEKLPVPIVYEFLTDQLTFTKKEGVIKSEGADAKVSRENKASFIIGFVKKGGAENSYDTHGCNSVGSYGKKFIKCYKKRKSENIYRITTKNNKDVDIEPLLHFIAGLVFYIRKNTSNISLVKQNDNTMLLKITYRNKSTYQTQLENLLLDENLDKNEAFQYVFSDHVFKGNDFIMKWRKLIQEHKKRIKSN